MKKIGILLALMLFGISAQAQVEVDPEGFETFKMQEGDTTYLMKKYFMVFLKRVELKTKTL